MAGGQGRNRFSRRVAMLAPVPALGIRLVRAEGLAAIRVDAGDTDGVRFRREDMGFVGVYDVDLLLRPEFGRMLDRFAASPGAFAGVRFFGIFTAGQAEDFRPESGGSVWSDPYGPIDFSIPFAALEALTSRGLIPFISLGFFPPAISVSPIAPPTDWGSWQKLVRAFLTELVADPRFGEERIRDWWFEIWNEPNEGRFWSGTEEQYFDLYRATSDLVVESELPIRLGGPAIAYKPQASPDDGAPRMERFLRFIASDPELRCDFVSLHRKGTVGEDPPDPRRLFDAAEETRALILAIDPGRFADVPVINNEADEKVGFEVPYALRMTHENASWLAAVAAIQGSLAAAEPGSRFMAAADNANLQLVQEPFDGRRSILTYALPDSDELIKLPAFGFYELLRMLDGRQGVVVQGKQYLFPATDLYHLTVASEDGIGTLLTWYPDPRTEVAGSRRIEIASAGIPWAEVNVAVYRIDREHGNSWTAAGGSEANPYPKPDTGRLPAMRSAQDVPLERPVEIGVAIAGGEWRGRVELDPFATVLIWINPRD